MGAAAVLFVWPALAVDSDYPTPPVAERIEGRVVRVPDGDGLILLTPSGNVEIRLQGIDAPELDQTCENAEGQAYPCGRAAAARLTEFALGRVAHCFTPADDPIDPYGRRLAFCRVGAVDLNIALLEEGHALVFRRFVAQHPQHGRRPHADAFLAAEQRARSARRGLWQGLFTPPWAYRSQRRR